MSELENRTFLFIWFGFTFIMMVILTGIIAWAVSRRQFKNQDKARRLPLNAEIRDSD